MAAEDKRYHLVDALRGLALLNMLAMHFGYDYFVVFGRDPQWHLHPAVHVWQQYICWSFILASGFVFRFGREKNFKRGLLINLCGLGITAVTRIAVPEETVWFGILNFFGCAIWLMIPLEKVLKKWSPVPGLAASFLLFAVFRYVNSGYLGLGTLWRVTLPQALYTTKILTPLGFPYPAFRSSDYFPLLPWFFLFTAGYFLCSLVQGSPTLQRAARVKIPVLSAVGRKTIWVYLLHQPVLMLINMLIPN
ncbi:MAG: DUF1624 domain-containing protein [Oscillospiraceae bacterium]|nr:DUF1624 domain-containing protein [Oscillospiraceae bacterium]